MRTLTLLCLLAGPAMAGDPPPSVVPSVDLARYMGTWYEIAAFPNWYQKSCTDTAVRYTLRDDGGFDLVNSCWKGASYKAYSAKGKVVDKATRAKIYVRFLPLLGTPYWIVDLDSGYRYAAVGTPKRNRLWIIARTPALDEPTYEGIVERLRALGYAVEKLVKTKRTGKAAPEKSGI